MNRFLLGNCSKLSYPKTSFTTTIVRTLSNPLFQNRHRFPISKNLNQYDSCRFYIVSSISKSKSAEATSLSPLGETITTKEESSSTTAKAKNQSEYIEGRYLIGFQCKVCETQNVKFMSKHAYTKGVVIIRCDGCSNLHLMADHLGWFDSQNPPGTIEDIMKKSGKSKEIKRLRFSNDDNENQGDGQQSIQNEMHNLPKKFMDGLMEYLPEIQLKKRNKEE